MSLKEISDYTLFEFGNVSIKIATIIAITIIVIVVMLILRFVKMTINRSSKIDNAKKYSIYQLLKYIIQVVGFLYLLNTLGFNISILLVGSSALLVGLGFGLQNLFSDFISGIIILLDSTVKVGDVIEINSLVGRVTEINFRTTTVITRDDKYIIIPNTDLTKNQLINWTHNNVTSRFEIAVGVGYESDIQLVIKLLNNAVTSFDGVLEEPKPIIRFTDFGDSSLNFVVLFWSNEVFRIENIKSDIRIKILELFRENNIQIPFPQRVVHLKNNQ